MWQEKLKKELKSAASWLGMRWERFSLLKKKMAVVLFCLLSGTISVLIICRPLLTGAVIKNTILIKPIYVPAHIGKPCRELLPKRDPLEMQQEMQRLQKLADSLKVLKQNNSENKK